jgi:hypothetical protein
MNFVAREYGHTFPRWLLKISPDAHGQTAKTLIRRVALAMRWHRLAPLSVISAHLAGKVRRRDPGSDFNHHEFLY